MRIGEIRRTGGMNLKRITRAGRIPTIALLLACLIIALFIPAEFASGSQTTDGSTAGNQTAGAGEVTLLALQVFTDTSAADVGRVFALHDETFAYRLTPKGASCPMPAGSGGSGYDFTITGTDEAEIGPIHFTKAGVYTYEIRHVTEPRPGYEYDQTVYTVEVLVESGLTATVIAANQNGDKVSAILYEHSYNEDEEVLPTDPSVTVDPPVVKTVAGNPSKPSTFTFRLTPGNPSNPMPGGAVNGVKTVKITGSGWADFGVWPYTKAGTYYYTVSEDNTGESNYIYDTTVFTIIDTVTAENGQLVAARVILNNANKQVTSLSFINTYTGGSPSSPGGKPGGNPGTGPKTGDETNATLYAVLFCAAGLVALMSLGYLLISGRRKGAK